ncbi:MAG: proton-conducting transporter membrane subunit [Candidatus Omnitrophica bacterium]|nr:proton-conducting transporter membrane subunit [Candidatus Omnitrophota bacterium]
MIETLLLLLILLPLIAGGFSLILPRGWRGTCAVVVSLVNFLFAVYLFKKESIFVSPWAGFGMDFSLRLNHFSGFIILAASFFGLLISLYALNFLKGKDSQKQFYTYLLISISFVSGAVLADNLVVLLFFWEALLLTQYGMIAIGGRQAFKTATKALIISGFSDLCMMAGIILTGYLAKTLTISEISLPLDPLGSLAFILLAAGAISKAGSIPFHTWIPDAAQAAPLPFMAFFPAAIEKLLGIYFLARITLDIFKLNTNSMLSGVLMIIGALTIIIAVMMALIQKDYKKLLSYHAISQVGYMILGIGTCLPAGIIGGIFHMINHALYKCGLFLTGGAVEKQTGTTDLARLGGLSLSMPVTFLCFLITAASISGVWPFNGFFSKELIYDAALERGKIFYLAAILGSFFTAASFLKLGHTAFLGKASQKYKEAPILMLIPMVILAFTCVIFGVFNRLPINNFIQPILGARAKGHDFSGMPANFTLVIVTIIVLLAAFLHHFIAVKINGGAIKAAEHIHRAPVLSIIYSWAEKKYLDPYELGIKLIDKIAKIFWRIDRGIDWVYGSLVTNLTFALSRMIHKIQAGYYIIYVIWSLAGAFLVISFVLRQ